MRVVLAAQEVLLAHLVTLENILLVKVRERVIESQRERERERQREMLAFCQDEFWNGGVHMDGAVCTPNRQVVVLSRLISVSASVAASWGQDDFFCLEDQRHVGL